jgi:hypothetical protein
VTLGGLIFVWRQLKVAELNARAAVDAAHAALMTARPWISVAVRTDGNYSFQPSSEVDFSVVTVPLSVENVGTTPALDVQIFLKVVSADDWRFHTDLLAVLPLDDPETIGVVVPGSTYDVAVGVHWEPRLPDTNPNPPNPIILAFCTYRIPGLAEPRRTVTPIAASVMVSDHMMSAISQRKFVVMSAQLSVIRSYRIVMT